MATWIYKQTIEIPAGARLDEIRCPACKSCQTVPEFIRPETCYTCSTKLEPDNYFKTKIIELLTEDGVLGSEA